MKAAVPVLEVVGALGEHEPAMWRGRSTIPGMGLNPFRQQRKTTIDVVLVVGFVLLTVAVVLWGFFGG